MDFIIFLPVVPVPTFAGNVVAVPLVILNKLIYKECILHSKMFFFFLPDVPVPTFIGIIVTPPIINF